MISETMREEVPPADDRDAFAQQAEPYRRQLHVHCYRLLGSVHEAEDLVQETCLRAWRARERFEGRTSFRNWLYRIATNACLNALSSRSTAARMTPMAYGPSTTKPPEGQPLTDVAWLEPYPIGAVDELMDSAPGPDARYELQESVQLAFVAAIQHLPPRQRAVLVLRDVLGWSATDTADLLSSSVASVNSALQRARATLDSHFPAGQPETAPAFTTADAHQHALLNDYVRAWETADIDGLVALLRDDAVISMPPWPNWYRGRDAVRLLLEWIFRHGDSGR